MVNSLTSEIPKQTVIELMKNKDLSILMGNIVPDVKKTRKNRK